MKLLERWWAGFVYVFEALSFTSSPDGSPLQQPLHAIQTLDYGKPSPVFPAPNGPEGTSDFVCNYTAMGSGWRNCSTPQNRECWLRGPKGEEYNIKTDYEKDAPKGTTRKVQVVVNLFTSDLLIRLVRTSRYERDGSTGRSFEQRCPAI